MLKIFGSLTKKERPFIRHPGISNLSIIPYVKGRLIFSELVARAMETEKFDFLAVDLPYFMNDRTWFDLPLKLFPIVSSLMIKRDNSNPLLFPFVPNDAGCISVSLARMKWVDFECLDDANLINYPEGSLFQPDISLKDDYFVFSDGLEGYFSPLWQQMSNVWNQASYVQRWFTSYRASVVVERLRRHLSERAKVLFVCEYQLWWAVQKVLEENSGEFKSPPALKWRDLDAALVIEDPYQLWAKGLLDDYPLINFKFCKSLQEGRALSFDKVETLNEVLMETISPEVLKETENPSIRLIITFLRYLKTRVVSYQRFTPLPILHLFESARSCLGKEFTRELAKKLLNYPYPKILKIKDIPPFFFKVTSDMAIIAGDLFELPDVFHAAPYFGYSSSAEAFHSSPDFEEERRYWADLVHPTITREEKAQMSKEGGGVRWAVSYDYGLHSRACSDIRNIVKRKMDEFKTEKYLGEVYDGIDWKATIYARAAGEQEAIYIRRKLHKNRSHKKIDEYTPIIFIFLDEIDETNRTSTVHDSNITQRLVELQSKDMPSDKYPNPDMVYSIFATSGLMEYLGEYHVQREVLTSIAFLFTGYLMGIERYEAINRRPKRFQCRLTPEEDNELRDFSLSEKGVAWAIKYAEEVVIVVACPGWEPSEKLQGFAKERGVEIATIPLSTLSTGLVGRLRHIHFISTPLKKHPESEKIVRRFLN
jgi:hypothetical protein